MKLRFHSTECQAQGGSQGITSVEDWLLLCLLRHPFSISNRLLCYYDYLAAWCGSRADNSCGAKGSKGRKKWLTAHLLFGRLVCQNIPS